MQHMHVWCGFIAAQQHEEWLSNCLSVNTKAIDLWYGGLSVFHKDVIDWLEVGEDSLVCYPPVRSESRCNGIDKFGAILGYCLAIRSIERELLEAVIILVCCKGPVSDAKISECIIQFLHPWPTWPLFIHSHLL